RLSPPFFPSLFLSYPYSPLPTLPSFPTRRSSDLSLLALVLVVGVHKNADKLDGLAGLVSLYVSRRPIPAVTPVLGPEPVLQIILDRKSTRLNSSHVSISYAVFCLKKKTKRDTYYK